jgi:hypothetical protein
MERYPSPNGSLKNIRAAQFYCCPSSLCQCRNAMGQGHVHVHACTRAHTHTQQSIKPLNTELNPIYHLLALLGAHHILHVSMIRINCI